MPKTERESAVRCCESPPRQEFLPGTYGSCSDEFDPGAGSPPRARRVMMDEQKTVRSTAFDSVLSVTDSGYSGVEEHSKSLHNFLEHATTYAFPVVFILALYSSAVRLDELELLWLIVPALPFTWALGDFVTGMLHWIADTYGSEETPILGQSIIKPFRLHHLYPRDICTHNLVVTVGNSCLIAVPVLAACVYILRNYEPSPFTTSVIFITVMLAPVTVATNLFHKFAHQENPSGAIRWLQRKGIILGPAHHKLHHTQPFDTNYCITNGWLNPALQKLKFFRGLEVCLSKLGIRRAPPG